MREGSNSPAYHAFLLNGPEAERAGDIDTLAYDESWEDALSAAAQCAAHMHGWHVDRATGTTEGQATFSLFDTHLVNAGGLVAVAAQLYGSTLYVTNYEPCGIPVHHARTGQWVYTCVLGAGSLHSHDDPNMELTS